MHNKIVPNKMSRRYFVGGVNARIIMGDDEVALLPVWRDIRREVEPEDLSLVVATRDPNRCWYQAIVDRMPVGWHVVAVCCATAAFLLVEWPWNFLLMLMLLLFPIRNERVRFYPFPTVAAKESTRTRESYRRGSPT
jgi:hypothetical protein